MILRKKFELLRKLTPRARSGEPDDEGWRLLIEILDELTKDKHD